MIRKNQLWKLAKKLSQDKTLNLLGDRTKYLCKGYTRNHIAARKGAPQDRG